MCYSSFIYIVYVLTEGKPHPAATESAPSGVALLAGASFTDWTVLEKLREFDNWKSKHAEITSHLFATVVNLLL